MLSDSQLLFTVTVTVVVRVAAVFMKYYLITNKFDVEQVASSHGLNQEELMDNVPSVTHLISIFWVPALCIIMF